MNTLSPAEQALASVALPPAAARLPSGARAVHWDELDGRPMPTIELGIELGRAQMGRDEVQQLRSGSVVPLDNAASAPLEIYAAGRLVARAEALELDGKLAVRITELVTHTGGN